MKIDLTLLKNIHNSIAAKSTGCPECFAKRLGISLRSFHETREFMMSELSAPIVYSRINKTYYYSEDWELYIGDLYRIKAELIKGVLQTINSTIKIFFLCTMLIF